MICWSWLCLNSIAGMSQCIMIYLQIDFTLVLVYSSVDSQYHMVLNHYQWSPLWTVQNKPVIVDNCLTFSPNSNQYELFITSIDSVLPLNWTCSHSLHIPDSIHTSLSALTTIHRLGYRNKTTELQISISIKLVLVTYSNSIFFSMRTLKSFCCVKQIFLMKTCFIFL